MCIQMIILSNIGKSAITFQFKKHINEKLSVSSKQFPQSVKISADSVCVSTPFLMSELSLSMFIHFTTRPDIMKIKEYFNYIITGPFTFKIVGCPQFQVNSSLAGNEAKDTRN